MITSNKTKIFQNSCWLTFDDGYKDHIKNVLPILIKNNLTASFFPTVTYNKNKIMSTNKIQFLLQKVLRKITFWIIS